MLDLVGYTADKDLSHVSIMEPSCGEGEFIIEILHRLKSSSARYGFSFHDAFLQNVSASDIDDRKTSVCVQRIACFFPELTDAANRIFSEDFLLASHENADIIVGNPPYIRYEQIPVDKRDVYKAKFSTFYYRADMYVLFFENTFRMLNPGGKHCFICSNRWMRNQYGRKLRGLVARTMSIDMIINMESANAFQEDVLAYPAVTLITNNAARGTLEYADIKSIDELGCLKTSVLSQPCDEDWSSIFAKDSDCGEFDLLEEQGFNIGIGIATGADAVFVSKDIKGKVEDELLIPTINAQNLRGNRMAWDGRYLLNPYAKNGQLIALDKYPLAKTYLESYRERLSNRHKAKKNPAKWYGTLDSLTPSLQHEPKILLPDISGNNYVFVDEGRYYPQHNIYYISGKPLRELKMLAAILMSDIVRNQLDKLTNHMNGGYARWQSQYLKKLRIPNVANIPSSLADSLLSCYNDGDIDGINFYVSDIVRNETEHSSPKSSQTVPQQLTLPFGYA